MDATEKEEEARLDAEWHALTFAQKRGLLGSPATDTLSPDVLRLIVAHFTRDPWSFFALAATCRLARDALGDDFYPYADKTDMRLWIPRLCYRVPGLRVNPRRVHDEKARYIELYDSSQQAYYVCDVDKFTGLILNTTHTRTAGCVWLRDPETAFKRAGIDHSLIFLKSHQDMKVEDATYPERNAAAMVLFKKGTDALKGATRWENKRLFSDVWDESGERRKRYKLK